MMMRLSILAVKPTSGTELIESVASWLGPTSPLLRATISHGWHLRHLAHDVTTDHAKNLFVLLRDARGRTD